MSNETLKKAFSATVPVMAGYLVLGAAFGILMADKGYSFLWSVGMSATVYAGSMQFVGVNLISGGASIVSAALMTLMVNARHLFYGISMLDRYKKIGRIKPYLIFGLTDETYALVCNGAPEGTDRRKYYLLVTLLDQLYWVLGSALGGLIGAAISFDTTGIDFAMTALFIVIFTEQLLSSRDKLPALIGVGASVVCLVIFGKDGFLIPAMLIIAVSLTLVGIFRGEVRE